MKARKTSFLLIPLFCFILSSCIEFESQELIYDHDEKKDQIRMTLNYKRIFGNLDTGENSQYGPADIATKDNLNQKQISQFESVLDEKRAFFFSNWIFEYNQRGLSEMLIKDKEIPVTAGRFFGKPEKELIRALIKEVKVENAGFYQDKKGRLCAAQTITISNASKIISLTNQILGRQLKERIQEMRDEVNNKIPNSFSMETIDLIDTKVHDDFPFIQIEGNLITLTMVMTQTDQKRIAKSTLKDLPHGTQIEFQDEALLIKIGAKHQGFAKLTKQCFEGYLPNALNHIQENHKKLFIKPRKIDLMLQNFLSGKN